MAKKCGLRMAMGGLLIDQEADRQQRISSGKELLSDLEGMNLSQGRKARMMGTVAQELAGMGVKTDLSDVTDGLSPGRQARMMLMQRGIDDTSEAVENAAPDPYGPQPAMSYGKTPVNDLVSDTQESTYKKMRTFGRDINSSPGRQELGGLGLAHGGLLKPEIYIPPPGRPTPTGGIRGNHDFAEGGIVRGKGGPTDDEVPMQVAGKNVNLSNTEAVLPAKTVQALGGPKAVEELIEQTNGKPPVKGGLREGGAYNNGLVRYDPVTGQRAAPGGPIPARQVAPVYDASTVGSRGGPVGAAANVIEGTATRVPNGSDRAVVPTNGQTQFHDKISAEEMARGNQNRAAGFKAAADAAPPSGAAHRAGRMATKGLNYAKKNPGAILGAAGDALAVYNAHNESMDHEGFYNDPNVPTLDKAAQAGRTVFRTGAPLAAGAVASAAGPWTGAAVGAGTYGAINATVDKDGQAFKQWEQEQEAKRVEEHKAAVAATPEGQAHAAVMAVPTQVSEKSILPPIDKEAARRNTLAAAQGALADQGNTQAAQVRAVNHLQRMSPEGIIMEKIRAAEANPNTDPRQLAYLGKALRYQRLDANGKAAVNMGADVDTVQQKYGATVGRERNGQLVVTAGHQYTPAQQEALRAQEAERMTAHNASQLRNLRYENARRDVTDPTITDPAIKSAGLRSLAMLQKQDSDAAEAAKARAEQAHKDRTARTAEGRAQTERDALVENVRQFNITQSTAAEKTGAAAANARLKALDETLNGVNLPADKLSHFKMMVNGGYLKDIKDKDGNLVAAGLESADPVTQRAAQQKLLATYLQTERANRHSTNGKSATQFELKKQSRLRPEDIYKAPGDLFRTLYDDDPTTMDAWEYAKRKMLPDAMYGGDRVDVGTNGVRVPSNIMSRSFEDGDGNLVMGNIDARRQRKTMADADR